MSVDPSRPIPVYFQLKTLLLEDILGGVYGPGDRLPTHRELAYQLGVTVGGTGRRWSLPSVTASTRGLIPHVCWSASRSTSTYSPLPAFCAWKDAYRAG
jgi:DNA-binding transcriptional MocR family regulator